MQCVTARRDEHDVISGGRDRRGLGEPDACRASHTEPDTVVVHTEAQRIELPCGRPSHFS